MRKLLGATRWTSVPAAAMLISTVPVLIIGSIAYVSAHRSMSNDVVDDDLVNARSAAVEITRFMLERVADIEVLASLPMLTNSRISHELSNADKDGLLDRLVRSYRTYNSIAIFDLEGSRLARSSGPRPPNPERDYLREVLRAGSVVVSAPKISAISGHLAIRFGVPVKDAKTGRATAIICAWMDVTEVERAVAEMHVSHDEYFVSDASGRIFLAPEKRYLGKNLRGEFPALTPLIGGAKAGTVITFNRRHGEHLLEAYVPLGGLEGLPPLGWQIVVSTRASVAYASLRRLQLILAIGTLLTAGLAYLLAAWMIVRETGPLLSDIAISERVSKEFARSEAYFRSLIENSSDVVAVYEPDGTVRYQSESGYRLFGWKPADWIGRPAFEAVHPDDREKMIKAFAQTLLDRDRVVTVECRGLHKDGSWRYCEVSGRSTLDPDGKPIVISNTRDITERRKLEEDLRKSEAYFRSLIENASDIVMTADPSGIISFVSSSAEPVLGYRPSEVIGTSLFGYIHPDDLALSSARIAGAASKPDLATELRVKRKDGSWCACEGVGRLITDPDGKQILALDVRDISERKRLEEELRKREAFFRSLIDNSSDLIFAADLTGTVRFAGGAVERLSQFTAQELIGSAGFSYVHPDDLPSIMSGMEELAKGERVWRQVRVRRKDGSWYPVEVTGTLATGSDGEPLIFVNQRDITERMEMAEKLLRSEAFYRSLIDESSDVIYATDLSGKIRFAGGALERVTQFSAQEVVGTAGLSYVHPDDLETAAAALAELAHEPNVMRRLRVRRKDGAWYVCELWAARASGPDGEPMIFVNQRDITERARFEEELRRARDAALESERLKSEFLANMSHEIRTPLNSIIGLSELLHDSTLTSEQREFVDTMSISGNALIKVINDVLDLSRIQSGKVVFADVEFDPRTPVKDALAVLAVPARTKQLQDVAIDRR